MTMEFIEARTIQDLRPLDMVDEGVYIQRIEVGTCNQAEAMPMVTVAEFVPEVGQCVLRPCWDGEHRRILVTTDLPIRVVRGGVQPPIRCGLAVEPCERCPR